MKLGRPIAFRAKLLMIAGISAIAFASLVGVGALLGQRVERQLTVIQDRYVPLLELEPELEGQFSRMQRTFQDAVAIRDAEELAPARDARAAFLGRLDAARGALNPVAAASLADALTDYFDAATDVSRRLIGGETGEGIVDAVAAMQQKQARVTVLLSKTTALDRHALAEAFDASIRTERTARTYQTLIGAAVLGAVLLLSLALSRSVLRIVSALAAGLERFGKGDFSQAIEETSQDELGSVATQANRMAASLGRLAKERDRVEADLKVSNRELEAFSYSVAHDLRTPLRGINGLSHALLDDYDSKLDDEGRDYLRRIAAGAERMAELIDALLTLARVTRTEIHRETVDMTRLADAIIKQLRSSEPERVVDFANQPSVVAHGDAALLRALLENLLGNAWKFTSARREAHIAFGVEERKDMRVYYVRDDGAGFNMEYANKLFLPFQRLHSAAQFAGTGIGLATVARIIQRHGGGIWAEGGLDQGATFHFTLPGATEGRLS